MLILGIDPGIGRTGWGLVSELSGSRYRAIEYGCFETEANSYVPDRLLKIHKYIHSLIQKYKPDQIAIEELFFSNNAKTAFVVGQARGVVLLASAEANLPISIYTPLQVKVAVTGYGKADKRQVGQMVKTILSLPEIPKPDDTADALAIALTHAFSHRTNRLKT